MRDSLGMTSEREPSQDYQQAARFNRFGMSALDTLGNQESGIRSR
jgi:hypothetical protein